ncbi:MAG TPA: hypothetical protein VGL13_12165 [Polyangiaceae bacterium]|jgi:hypothetical protein
MNRFVPWILLLAAPGCFKAPGIVVVDRATALEQQAGGSFEEVEGDLAKHAVEPRPVPLTPDQLESLGLKPTPIVDHTDQTEADRVDGLLRQRCIGEAKDALLVDTHDDCIGASDRGDAIALIDRTNRARLQLFRWMHASQPGKSSEALRREWRDAHLHGVVCRGWIQQEDGKWEPKKC